MVNVRVSEPKQLPVAHVPACPAAIEPLIKKVCSTPLPLLLKVFVPPLLVFLSSKEYCKPLTTPLLASNEIVYGNVLVHVAQKLALALTAAPSAL